MEKINMMVRIVSISWGIALFFLYILSGKSSKLNDRGSSLLLFVVIGFIIQFGIPSAIKSQQTGFGFISNNYKIVAYTGVLAICLGIIIEIISIYTLKKQFSVVVKTIENHKLIDYGIYKYIRHPMYTAALLIVVGFGLALANWIYTIIFAIIGLIAFGYRIIIEERFLEEYFGEKYLEYKKRTKKIIPKIY